MESRNGVSSRFIEAYYALVDMDMVSGKKDFASNLGISPSMVTEISKGRSSVGVVAIQNIVLRYGVDADWILTGNGSMFNSGRSIPPELTHSNPEKGENYVPPTAPMDAAHEPNVITSSGRDEVNSNEGIPLIPISAMAGIFTGDTSIMEYECERYVIPDFKGADFLIRVKGDSMQPTYYSGDLVACQRVPLDDLFFQWNKTYVLDTVQGPLIKRVKQGSDDNHVLIVSDNTDYEPFELSKDQFHGVALVRGLVRLE